ncbi:phosphatidate cytidylyltransferase [Spirochaetia bacterium]|nr:phosphatidate cytidylyltransferase [Spirochaetia bacterium]
MTKIIQRLLIFFIGIPLVVLIVVFLPQNHHLAVNIAVIIFSGLGAVEFADILKRKGLVLPAAEAAILGIISPVAMTVVVSFGLNGQVMSAAFIIGGCWLLVSRIFAADEKLRDYTIRTATGFSVMMYPGLFMVWIIRMTLLPRADMVILMFLLMVFGNDSFAWAAGILFGKGNRGIITASPNKSIAGFVGGLIAAILAGIGGALFISGAFVSRSLHPIFAGALLGFVTGAAGSLGDLAESALKRSSGIKDSGSIIPGRGGVLDSIDSLALAAPVFYVAYRILFG